MMQHTMITVLLPEVATVICLFALIFQGLQTCQGEPGNASASSTRGESARRYGRGSIMQVAAKAHHVAQLAEVLAAAGHARQAGLAGAGAGCSDAPKTLSAPRRASGRERPSRRSCRQKSHQRHAHEPAESHAEARHLSGPCGERLATSAACARQAFARPARQAVVVKVALVCTYTFSCGSVQSCS